jgi:hypothetical protein
VPILCEYKGKCYLCGGSADPQWLGWVSLIGRRDWQLPNGLDWQREDVRAYAALKPHQVSGVRFFPTILYRGCKVRPRYWHREAAQPLLLISMWIDDLILEKYFVKPPANDAFAIQAAMEADGWSWDLREGGDKYVHVDELEKIEGPPPQGAY